MGDMVPPESKIVLLEDLLYLISPLIIRIKKERKEEKIWKRERTFNPYNILRKK